ncbi:MAG: peptidoglycan-binding protein [Actinomycetota bacterium]|nr:peptidoglycan-binding protein [Actinomycetota bacterium]
MSRSLWAAAGVSVLTFALTPVAALAAGPGSSAARSAGAHARQNVDHRGLGPAIRRSRHLAARAVAQRPGAGFLAPGSGYQQAAGSGRVRVRVLQRRLAARGFAPGPIDGLYGPLTARAVIDFQAAHGLRIDGVAGPETLTRLHVTVPGSPPTARLTRYRRAHLRPTASAAARSPRPVHARASTPPPLPRQLQNPAVTNHPQGTSDGLMFWLMLAGLIAASVLLIGAALSRRFRGRPRRRHYIRPGKLTIARLAGFRYSPGRDAYVLRLVGNLVGPVLKFSESASTLTAGTRGSATARTTTTRLSLASPARSSYAANGATQHSRMGSSETSPRWRTAPNTSSPPHARRRPPEGFAVGDAVGLIRTASPPAAPEIPADFTPAVRSARRIASGSVPARPEHERSSAPPATAVLLAFAGLGLRWILRKNEEHWR